MLCKACTDKGLVYSAKGRILKNMVYVRNVHFTKGQAYSWERTPSSRQRGSYIRTITARFQLKKSLVVSLKGLDASGKVTMTLTLTSREQISASIEGEGRPQRRQIMASALYCLDKRLIFKAYPSTSKWRGNWRVSSVASCAWIRTARNISWIF
jgi:hypothetical protein